MKLVLLTLLLGLAHADNTYQCQVCQHVYDAQKDGGGKPFEQLPDSFKCPVCGSPKSAFKKQAGEWVVEEPVKATDDVYTCSVCQHVYDAQKDGGGKPFEQLPDSFKCPVCGSPKSAFKKQGDAWVAEAAPAVADDVYKCSVCQHVYDAQKDGGGKPFEQLPDSFKCPVCGSPKSAFKKQADTWVAESAPALTDDVYKCSVCQHVYDAQKDGGGKSFDQLPDSFKCPVCGAPKSAFKKVDSSKTLVV